MADSNEIQVTISYFSLLEEQADRKEEQRRTTATTPRQLYEELSEQYGIDLPVDALKVAVNDEFSEWDATLEDEDKIAFIPPVAGG